MRWVVALMEILLSHEIVSQFSLRGRWPTKRYQKILETQLYIRHTLHLKRDFLLTGYFQ